MNKTLCKLLAWIPIWIPSVLIEIWAWTYIDGTISQDPEGFWNIIATLIVVITGVLVVAALCVLAFWAIANLVRFCQAMEKNCGDCNDDHG